ncbi:hypothetical protein E2C01_023923 [Portunus trituberculatus]|uniref:Uncharacterized protein n=1 Tax=Portunus trituberculatus TaxID=210409 RepID=A0A5B7EBC6_PORTR|nr:hypothetical protein [Portunus trituberculatus]
MNFAKFRSGGDVGRGGREVPSWRRRSRGQGLLHVLGEPELVQDYNIHGHEARHLPGVEVH